MKFKGQFKFNGVDVSQNREMKIEVGALEGTYELELSTEELIECFKHRGTCINTIVSFAKNDLAGVIRDCGNAILDCQKKANEIELEDRKAHMTLSSIQRTEDRVNDRLDKKQKAE